MSPDMSPDMDINFIRFNIFYGETSRTLSSCASRLNKIFSGLNRFTNRFSACKHNSDERNRVAAAEETMAAVAMEEGDKHFNMNLDFFYNTKQLLIISIPF